MIAEGVHPQAVPESLGYPGGVGAPAIWHPHLRHDFPDDSGGHFSTLCPALAALAGGYPLKAPTIRARYTLAILFAINLLNFYDRHIPGAIVEPLRKDWGLSDAQIGWLATAFTLLYAVVGVPFGRLSDRFQRSKLLGLGIAAWSLLTAAPGLIPGHFPKRAHRRGTRLASSFLCCGGAGDNPSPSRSDYLRAATRRGG